MFLPETDWLTDRPVSYRFIHIRVKTWLFAEVGRINEAIKKVTLYLTMISKNNNRALSGLKTITLQLYKS